MYLPLSLSRLLIAAALVCFGACVFVCVCARSTELDLSTGLIRKRLMCVHITLCSCETATEFSRNIPRPLAAAENWRTISIDRIGRTRESGPWANVAQSYSTLGYSWGRPDCTREHIFNDCARLESALHSGSAYVIEAELRTIIGENEERQPTTMLSD